VEEIQRPDTENTRPAFVMGAIDSRPTTARATTCSPRVSARRASPAPLPAVATATSPTVAELRRLAIYNNYRALVDIDRQRRLRHALRTQRRIRRAPWATGDGKIAGEEHIAFADDGSGRQNVTMMVQIPSTFSTTAPCIVAAPSSGSRGVYGAIGTAGEWGLKRGCAVAYTDKGTGNGGHDIAANAVNVMLGARTDAAAAGRTSHSPRTSPRPRSARSTRFPEPLGVQARAFAAEPRGRLGPRYAARDRVRLLHAERASRATRAVSALRTFVPSNTLVIASQRIQRRGAALAAAEHDTEGLIDGVAVAEPQSC
jgi:hydroxybutyrate-dimer hydrolase